jgi:hypothetical protein
MLYTKSGLLLALVVWSPLCAPAEEAAPAQPVPDSSVEVPVPAPTGAPSLQMSIDSAYPALNFGTYQPIGQVEARGVRVAPFTVRTAVQTGMGYDDNVALRQSNKIGSLFLTVAPSVSVGLEGATERYYLVYRGNYGVYASSRQDDYDDHNVALSAANSWTTRFRTLATYEYTKGHTPRGISTSSIDVSERWYVQSVKAGASYGPEGAQGRIEGNAGHSTRRYSSDTAGACI